MFDLKRNAFWWWSIHTTCCIVGQADLVCRGVCVLLYVDKQWQGIDNIGIREANQKNYETYNNERKEQVFASNSKFQIASNIYQVTDSKYQIAII